MSFLFFFLVLDTIFNYYKLIEKEKFFNNQMRILKSHPLLRLVNSYLIDSSEPSNISFL